MQKVKIIQVWYLVRLWFLLWRNAPGLSVGPPYACQSSLSFDPLQVRDPWQSWHSGPGSKRGVTQALWAQYGPTTTSVRSVNP